MVLRLPRKKRQQPRPEEPLLHMGALRASSILAGFFALTVPLMPVQAVLLIAAPRAARRLPHWYHAKVCRLMGLQIEIEGEVAPDQAALLISNHTSWLDIPVLSAVAPVSFVAKKEVGAWPFVSSLARLQRSVFVDRTRRQAAGDATGEIMERLGAGDSVVLFAEGTSSDGNRVLPFKTSLFGAVKSSARGAKDPAPAAVVQTVAVVYTRLCGVPLGRADRPRVSWYGDMEMQSHAWQVLKSGPLHVKIRIGPPVPLDTFSDRKELALITEREVRAAVHRLLRGRRADEPLEAVEPAEEHRSKKLPARAGAAQKWT
jgi:lyso-ornithine lipid O-acyltransferase